MKNSAPRIVFLCLISAAAAWAQPEVVSHDAPATFSSRVNLVTVPVVVRDRAGHPIGSLRQEDFQLSDKGKAQVISRFSIETSIVAGKAPAATAVEPGAAAESTKPVLPSRYVAYLFDDIHTKVGDLLQGRQAANRQLDHTLDPNTRAGIFTTSGRTTQDFTSDAEKLHAAVNRIQPWEGGLDTHQDCPPISFYLADLLINQEQSLSPGTSDAAILGILQSGNDQALNAVIAATEACLHTSQMQVVLPQTRTGAQRALAYGSYETMTGLTVLKDLVHSMSALPGSRSIVMVSPGFILATEQRVFENDVLEKAIHANVTINTLDVQGLFAIPGMQASEPGVLASGYMLQADTAAREQAQDLLGELASGTGGTFFHNDNALEEGLEELAARPEYVYMLGFSPNNLKFDGSYHGLKVTLKNGATLKIDARRGYWAPNHTIDPAEEAREEIQDAVFSREELHEIPVKLHTEFFKESQNQAELTVETRVDLKGLKFRKAEDRNRDTLNVVTGLFDLNGRYIKGTERTLEMRLLDKTMDAARNSGLIVKQNFDVPPGRYIVRVVVRDTEGRSMAAQNEGVEIP
jgi:VWFA-related protein